MLSSGKKNCFHSKVYRVVEEYFQFYQENTEWKLRNKLLPIDVILAPLYQSSFYILMPKKKVCCYFSYKAEIIKLFLMYY